MERGIREEDMEGRMEAGLEEGMEREIEGGRDGWRDGVHSLRSEDPGESSRRFEPVTEIACPPSPSLHRSGLCRQKTLA